MEGRQLSHGEPVSSPVLRPVGQHRAVRPHGGGDERAGEVPAASRASDTLSCNSRRPSLREIPRATNPSKEAW